MQFPDTPATRQTETVMAALRGSGVLKDDRPGFPNHYNRAFSAVHDALTALADREAANRPPQKLPNPNRHRPDVKIPEWLKRTIR